MLFQMHFEIQFQFRFVYRRSFGATSFRRKSFDRLTFGLHRFSVWRIQPRPSHFANESLRVLRQSIKCLSAKCFSTKRRGAIFPTLYSFRFLLSLLRATCIWIDLIPLLSLSLSPSLSLSLLHCLSPPTLSLSLPFSLPLTLSLTLSVTLSLSPLSLPSPSPLSLSIFFPFPFFYSWNGIPC